jgi:hypothetical protein
VKGIKKGKRKGFGLSSTLQKHSSADLPCSSLSGQKHPRYFRNIDRESAGEKTNFSPVFL